MKEPKKILLLVVVIVLIGSVGYLTYLLQGGSGFLTFNTRASTNADDLLIDDATSDPVEPVSPSPSDLAYQSTSPTVSPVTSPSISVSPSISPTEEPTLTPTSIVISAETPTPIPTTVESLPVAGVADHLPKILIGGGALILLALFL